VGTTKKRGHLQPDNFVVSGKEILDDTQTDMSLYRQLTFALQRFARQRDTNIFFIVDGVEEIPEDTEAQAAILRLLPIGMSYMKFLISAKSETVMKFVGSRVSQKSFVLFGFALEETITYFSDLHVDRKFVDELFQVCNRGIPAKWQAFDDF